MKGKKSLAKKKKLALPGWTSCEFLRNWVSNFLKKGQTKTAPFGSIELLETIFIKKSIDTNRA
jgi:hypothetical protein